MPKTDGPINQQTRRESPIILGPRNLAQTLILNTKSAVPLEAAESKLLQRAMVKAYLRYEPALSFGVIASVDSNIAYDSSGKHLLAPALEKVGVWNVRQGVCTKTLTPSLPPRGFPLFVTCIAPSPSSPLVISFSSRQVFAFVFV